MPASRKQEKVAGILGVAQGTIAKWEGASIIPENNTCNPPGGKQRPRKMQVLTTPSILDLQAQRVGHLIFGRNAVFQGHQRGLWCIFGRFAVYGQGLKHSMVVSDDEREGEAKAGGNRQSINHTAVDGWSQEKTDL